MSLLLTLVGGLGGFGDIDGELATEGIHSHHSRVDGGVGEGGELVVVAGDAVERFGDVCSSFQDYFLQDKKEKKKNRRVTNEILTNLFSQAQMKQFPVQRLKVDAFLSEPAG